MLQAIKLRRKDMTHKLSATNANIENFRTNQNPKVYCHAEEIFF